MMASSSCMPAGRRPCARSSATAGFKPAFSARRWCAYHSYCAVQWRAVTRIASSFRRAGSELRNRICSPNCRSRSASAGLRRYTLNGLPMVPAPGTTAALPVAATGPDMTAFAYARCAGVISLNGVSLKRRMSSCAHALPASKASPENSNPTVQIFIWRSPWMSLVSHRFGIGMYPVEKSVLDSFAAAHSSCSPVSRGQQRHSGEALQLVEGKPWHQAARYETARRDVDHGEVGIDALDHADAGKRISAALDDLRLSALGEMLHHYPHVPRPDREVHRAAHRRNRVLRAGVPVGKVAADRNLERAQHGDIEMAAAHHRERIGVVEVRAARQQGHGLLPGVDQIRVLPPRCGCRTHSQDPVLAVQENLAVLRQMVGDQCRHADAQIDVRALGDVVRDALRDLLAREFGVAHAACSALSICALGLRGTFTTRVTKIPGVTMHSGSSAPSSTTS